MEPGVIVNLRVLKRLKAAVGYHELGMTQHALQCIDSLATLGNIGSFGMAAEVLRDEFVKHRENDVSAANALKMLATMLPSAERRAIRMTLAACYGKPAEKRRAAEVRSQELAGVSPATAPDAQM